MADMTLEEALAAADVSTTPVNDILMIDPESRTIIVPASEMLFGVRQDMDAERKHFKCPKIVGDNIDLSQCHIYISYVPSKQDGTYDINDDVGGYWCEDLAVDGDYITFSWKLSGNVFAKAGYIAFAVYAKQEDADGNMQTKWHTTFAIGKVLDTLPDGEQIAEKYADVIEQLLNKMENVEKVATPEAMKGYVEEFLNENPPSGMTDEEREQLNKNTEDISSLSEEMTNLDVRSISSITKTSSDGLIDTYTIKYTDGTTSTYTIKNGDADSTTIKSIIDELLLEHPEWTTTVQDGTITEAKLADDVKNKLGTSNDYKWIAKGQMREPVRDFQGWAHGVQFDKELGVAVCMIISGEGSHSNKAPYYRATIEQSTGYMSEYEEVMVYDADGNELTDCGYFSSFNILSDGTYIMTDYYRRFFTSDDKGYTWNYSHTVTMENEADNCTIWGITELSNGRWLASNGGHDNSYGGTFYSDDKGKTWTRVKTTTVTGAADAGWSFPEGVTPFEAVFIEIGNGKVVQYARATNNGRNSSGTARANQEPALFSKSDDYGTTWTTFVCSAGITDMSCCNGKIVIKDGYVHFLYGSRRLGITDPEGNVRNGCMYYTKTTLENAYLDVWETPVIVDYDHWDADTAASVTDIGYPSLWLDNLGNLNGVYYDSAESTGDNAAYCANWRYLVGNPYLNQYLIKNESSGSKVVSYSQKKVDEIIASLVSDYETKISELDAKLTKKIAQIVISGGGSIGEEDDSTDGTMYILSGLVDCWNFTEESNYDIDNNIIKSEFGKYGMTYAAYDNTIGTVTKKSSNRVSDLSGNAINTWGDGIDNGVSFELLMHSIGTGGYCLGINTDLNNVSNTAYMFSEKKKIYPANGALVVSDDTTAWWQKTVNADVRNPHLVVTYTADKMTLYENGMATYSLTAVDAGIDAFDLEYFKSAYVCTNRQSMYIYMMRIYNKALTAEEVQNNYQYELSNNPVFKE